MARKAKTFLVETYRPAYPEKGLKVRVHNEKDFDWDCTSPTLTSLFRVEHVTTKEEAIAACVEKLADKNVCVYRLIPA